MSHSSASISALKPLTFARCSGYLRKLARQCGGPAEAIGGSGRPNNPTSSAGRPTNGPLGHNDFRGGGGSVGGGGASGSWDAPAQADYSASRPSTQPERRDHAGGSASLSDKRGGDGKTEHRTIVVRNGYTYEIDARGRTRRVSGVLSDSDMPARSATNQAKAGGEDRRASDDGGHYIAARFDGPKDAFNHFARNQFQPRPLSCARGRLG
ncbi:DNA/RNA non-specific endonuclease [Sphingomonas sp. S2-65]|uniref:DNA/RNA non-specific endonuclease n=1 Tax=Sphingomonas sp. S2-65 TaxID=2903960 RepID=UPI001F1EE822|nr:DNA/RNA non-specific endonuclease [Sphingomonas sp. S2-65]UYY60371.1 DNA/RNA non-specific endonuclease [Sphingomonas sp. S2-65]